MRFITGGGFFPNHSNAMNFDLGTREPDKTPVEIIPRRNMFLRCIGEDTLRPCTAGERVTVERHELRPIHPGDYKIASEPSASITDHGGR